MYPPKEQVNRYRMALAAARAVVLEANGISADALVGPLAAELYRQATARSDEVPS